ncbi:MAG TPA: gamma-glutamyl-gamma-aminobutyrate hydrolase family protein [Candidatus Kapabacteria bacterium]|nr:gamma-glutamyl-gamma-aminobutyrate hydrolase family protein [Candidatus Kapabacteria bacterium]
MKLTIGLSYAPSDNPKYDWYRKALYNAAETLDYEIELVDLSHGGPVADVDGVLFTGGADIDPARYGKQSEEHLCGEIDEERDQIEFNIAEKAEEHSTPVLGICRGLQLLNVHHGGTLITDIEAFGGASHRKVDGFDARHNVKVEPGSYLRHILSEGEGEVNSAHHQAVERVGDGLMASARAMSDGTIESLEWADATGKPFFLAVQWHPERMDFSERFAGRIFETFLWEVAANKMLKHRTKLQKEKV